LSRVFNKLVRAPLHFILERTMTLEYWSVCP
jgi:hypothetical protein